MANIDGIILLTDTTDGVSIEDAHGFITVIKETTEGLELTVNDGVNVPTVYEIVDGKLKNVMELNVKVNDVDNAAITAELVAANYQPVKGEIIVSSGVSYEVISAEADATNQEYEVNLNDLGALTFEGQIATVVNAALTAELVKLGRYDWIADQRISYLDSTTKIVEVTWAKFDTENGKYIVNCALLS